MADNPNHMKVAKLKIDNVLSIEAAEIDVGDGLALSGRTGAGKTAFLDAIAAAFGKKNRVMMLRKGEEEGRVLLVMDDGTQISRKVGQKGLSRAVVRDPQGKPVPSPQHYLDSIAPALNFNPAAFIAADGKSRIRMLANAFPVEIDKKALEDMAAGLVEIDDLPDKVSLEQIGEVYRRAYQARAELNGQVRQIESEKEAEQTRVPKGFDPDSVRGLSTADLASELARLETHNRRVAEVRKNLDRLKSQREGIEQQIRELQARLEQINEKSSEAETWLQANPEKPVSDLQERIAKLDEQRTILGHYDRTQALAEQLERTTKKAKLLDKAVKRYRALPAQLAESADIPIPGLSIEEKDIYINGLPFENLSDGQKMQVAIKVAKAGAGELKLICIDGAEKLSEDARQEMIEDLLRGGFQVFVTVTDNSNLEVTPVNTLANMKLESAENAEENGVSGKDGHGEEVDLDDYFEAPEEEDTKHKKTPPPEQGEDNLVEIVF